ncbi:MAG: hypothetical protein IPM13_05565 [Phycisphaerales bacterium]|nr:hypothetical protein [Phycisphaerales bacterium]
MDWLTWLLLESPAALGTLLGLTLFVLLVRWRRGGSPRPLVVALAVSVVLLVTQALVVTHRERAAHVLDAIAADIARARTGALAAALDEQFDAGRHRGEPLTRARFVEYVQALLRRINVVWVQRTDLDITGRQPGRFVAEAQYLAEINHDQLSGTFRSRWAVTFARTAHGWQIVQIEPMFIDGVPVASWERIARE